MGETAAAASVAYPWDQYRDRNAKPTSTSSKVSRFTSPQIPIGRSRRRAGWSGTGRSRSGDSCPSVLERCSRVHRRAYRTPLSPMKRRNAVLVQQLQDELVVPQRELPQLQPRGLNRLHHGAAMPRRPKPASAAIRQQRRKTPRAALLHDSDIACKPVHASLHHKALDRRARDIVYF